MLENNTHIQFQVLTLHVELDAQVVVNLVQSKKVINNSCVALLNDCKYFLEFQHVKVTHVFREANRCADNLARAGCSFSRNFVVLDAPHNDGLCNILNADADGLYTLRLSTRTSPFMANYY